MIGKAIVSIDNTIVWRSPDGTGKQGNLPAGQQITITNEKGNYGFTESPLKGWISKSAYTMTNDTPPPPPTTPKKVVSAVVTYNDGTTETLYPLP